MNFLKRIKRLDPDPEFFCEISHFCDVKSEKNCAECLIYYKKDEPRGALRRI